MCHKNKVNVNIYLHVSTLLMADVQKPSKGNTFTHHYEFYFRGLQIPKKKKPPTKSKLSWAGRGAYACWVNPVAVGDEHTYRWYIKTAITRTPGKAKNQSEWIVKPASKKSMRNSCPWSQSVIPLNVGGPGCPRARARARLNVDEGGRGITFACV